MKTGRPTKYSQEIVDKTIGYIESCGETHEVKTRPVIKEGVLLEEEYIKEIVRLPTIEGLANVLDINKDTLYEWCKEHEEFSDVIERLKKMQGDMLINNGLSGTYNPTIAKVLLTKHGYREGTDVTTDGKEMLTKNFSEEEQAKLLALLK